MSVEENILNSIDDDKISSNQDNPQSLQNVYLENENDKLNDGPANIYVNGSMSTDGDGSFTNPYNNLKSAFDNSTEGSIINIAPGIYTGYNKNVELEIDKKFSVRNWTDGEVIIYGDSSKLWIIRANEFNITGLTFQRGHSLESYYSGGLTFLNGLSNSIINATFIDNDIIATNYMCVGGAIFVRGNSINNTFAGIYRGSSAFDGGAIYIASDSINTTFNAYFIHNTASNGANSISFGGDIYNNVIKGKFINNTGSNSHAVKLNKCINTLIDADFINGTAKIAEPGIWCNEMNNSTIKGNFINNSHPSNSATVFIDNLINSIINATFINNHAQNSGAAYVHQIINSTISGLFINNSAAEYGGAIGFYSSNNATITAKFINNTAGTFGGAIYARNPYNTQFVDCEFINNRAENGGAIYSLGNGLIVKNSNFTKNSANTHGGAMYFKGEGTVNNCNFIHCGEGTTVEFETAGILTGSNFINTTGSYNTLHSNSYLIVRDCNFINITSEYSLIYARELNITYSNISQCTLAQRPFLERGVAITTSELFMAYCNFNDNYGKTYASTVYLDKGLIDYCNFSGNHADYHGGAVTIGQYANVSNSIFRNNNGSYGGALYIYQNASIINTIFENNNAGVFGGAIYTDATVSIIDSVFNNNSAVIIGGAIQLEGGGTIENSNFTGNKATLGGAIYGREGMNILYSTFNNNSAQELGGAIYVSKNGDFRNCDFNDNYAEVDGGAIYSFDNGFVSWSNFNNNFAVGNGGAIFFNDGGTVSDSSFNSNIAKGNGGAVFFNQKNNAQADLEENFFFNNVATEGGALSLHANGIIRYNTFKNNLADNGGAIITDSDLYLRGSVFENNFATLGTNHVALIGNGTIVDSIYVTPEDLRPNRAVHIDLINITDNVLYGETVNVTVNVTCEGKVLNEGIVLVTVNNINYTADVVNGIAKLQMPDVNAGSYNVNMNYVGDPVYTKGKMNLQFNVDFIIVPLESVNVTNITYGESLNVIARLPESINTGNVYAVINNDVYVANVTNGTAIFEIQNLDAGSYDAFFFYSDMNAMPHVYRSSFNVEKQNATITAKNAAYVINYGGKYSVTVTGAAGEKVTFTLNGKNIGSATVDAKGIATITLTAKILKAAKIGSKNMVIKLANDNYNCLAKTVKITISKEASKLVAKNKKFKKALKTKKYAITLKNSKGKAISKVQVTLKVKGKTYKAKTNAKGKAIFKIKNLKKKGTFKATIKFKGNAYYKNVSKKAKITIK